MLDLRLYRRAFAAALAVLVVIAFSLDGLPEPLEPPPVTLTFDGSRAAQTARQIAALGDDRSPGSAADEAAADLVVERFAALESGTVSEQRFEAGVEGGERELRNVILTLPGSGERSLVVVAGRDSRLGPGTAAGAAATGVLVELAQQLGVADRSRTVILASTDGAAAESQGARELATALPSPDLVDAVLVVSQPSAADPEPPHVVTSAGGERAPAPELVATAAAQLERRTGLDPGLDGAFGQLARLALPGAAGEQAALAAEGFDAVALSAAGEAPPPAAANAPEALQPAQLTELGTALVATVAALDTRTGPLAEDDGARLRFPGNALAGWTLALLGLALLVPPGAISVSWLARAARRGGHPASAASWALGWLGPGAAALALIYALALVGAVPAPRPPYDPGRFALGPGEGLAIAVVAAAAVTAWWAQGLRRLPSAPERATVAAACGATATGAGLALWLANPYLALLAVPLTHLVALWGLPARRRRRLAIPLAALALVPLAAASAHVADRLDWGSSAPWQAVLLVAGRGAGPLETAALLSLFAASGALLWATLAPARRPRPGRERDRPASAVAPPGRD